MVKPRNLKAIPVLVNQRAVIKMGFLLWCSVAALMFPITLHMVQLFTDYKKKYSDVKTRCFLYFEMAGWLPIFTISYSVQREKKKFNYHNLLRLNIALW